MPKTVWIFPLLASLLTLSSCSDKGPGCAPDRTEYFFIKPEERAVLPYKGFDTIKMKHSSGAIYTFVAGPLDSGFNITARSTSPDCPNNIFEYKPIFSTKFKNNINESYAISFNMYIPSYYSSYSSIYIIFQKHEFEFDTDFDQFPTDNITLYDSLNINGLVYLKVTKKISKSTTNNYVFYNSKYGMLKFILSNGETWERIHN